MAYVNGEQVELQRGPVEGQLATLINDLQVRMAERNGSLVMRFTQHEEVMRLAGMLGLGSIPECEGTFPTLVARIGKGLDSAYSEADLTLNIWNPRRRPPQ